MRTVAAVLVAVAAAVVAAIALAFAFGGLSPGIAWCALVFGALLGGMFLLREGTVFTAPLKLHPWEWFVIVCYTLVSLRLFLWLVFIDGTEVKFIATNNLGDLSLHLAYINYLANGPAFWPANPIFAAAPIHYPLGADLFNSLLLLAGMDVYRSLIWAGLVAALITGTALYRWGGAFTMAGFLFNGGVVGFQIFRTLKFADYQDAVDWKSIPLALFVTQRGLLYAIPGGLLLLWSWRRRFFPGNAVVSWRLPLWVEVLLYSTMPLFHLHTFIFLSLLLAWWVIVEPPARKGAATLIGWALLPATACVMLITDFPHGASAIWWLPGWMQGDENFFVFWFKNFGVLLLLVPMLLVALVRQRAVPSARAGIAFVVPAVLVFLLACFVMFAKWEWDNTKIMLWSYLTVLPWIWSQLLAPRPAFVQYTACVMLFLSGFVSLVGGIDRSHGGYSLARRTDIAEIAAAVRALPIHETFAAYPTYNHPLLLVGRKLVAGYEGHLSSHGVDYAETIRNLKSLMLGEPDWGRKAATLGVRYLFWGENERNEYAGSKEPWKEACNRVAEGPWGAIYDLGSPASDSH
jgi:hypothetical protein